MVKQTTERVPPESSVDMDAIPHARLAVLRKYVVVVNLLVVPEITNKLNQYLIFFILAKAPQEQAPLK